MVFGSLALSAGKLSHLVFVSAMFSDHNIRLMTSHRSSFMIAQLCE